MLVWFLWLYSETSHTLTSACCQEIRNRLELARLEGRQKRRAARLDRSISLPVETVTGPDESPGPPTDRPATGPVRRRTVAGVEQGKGQPFIEQFPYKSCQRSRTPRKVTGHQPAARARRPSTAAAKRPRTGAGAGRP